MSTDRDEVAEALAVLLVRNIPDDLLPELKSLLEKEDPEALEEFFMRTYPTLRAYF